MLQKIKNVQNHNFNQSLGIGEDMIIIAFWMVEHQCQGLRIMMQLLPKAQQQQTEQDKWCLKLPSQLTMQATFLLFHNI